MKLRLTIVFLASAALTVAVPRAAHAQVDVNVSANLPGIQINAAADFYQPLTPYGSWVDVSPYGRCFHPGDVAADWEPYTVGSWEWTDSGWYWDSDEPWGWATCHYGSWYNAPSVGWVWIPGTEWAPAWVDWRDSDDYIGWAPCGPGRAVLAPQFFTFCDIHHFHDHFRGGGGGVLIRNNVNIINRTRVVNNFSRTTADIGGRHETIFANRGPAVDRIEHATGQKFQARPVGDVVRESRRPESMRGNETRQPDRRNEQRPETPSPTGREQQRNYQQQQQQDRNLQQRQQEQRNISPTGREQQRNYQQQQQQDRNLQQRQQEQRQQEQRPNLPATGREQQRNFQQPTPATPSQHPDVTRPPERVQPHETPNPAPPAEQHREMPTPRSPEAAPNRPLPPTGREEARPEQRRAAPSASERQAPAAPQRPQDGHDKKQDGQ